jgi:hypothetical protein
MAEVGGGPGARRSARPVVEQNRSVRRVTETLVQYGQQSAHPALDWAWVDGQLSAAGTYWASICADRQPHPRPVWGVWAGEVLHLSIGSPQLAAAPPGTLITVHLDSGSDVVIVDGVVSGRTIDPALIAAYDVKYTWSYDVDTYGPLTSIHPQVVLGWRSAGWAGREGFTATGRWRWVP